MRDRMAESIEKFGVTTDLLEGNQNYLLIPKKHFSLNRPGFQGGRLV